MTGRRHGIMDEQPAGDPSNPGLRAYLLRRAWLKVATGLAALVLLAAIWIAWRLG